MSVFSLAWRHCLFSFRCVIMFCSLLQQCTSGILFASYVLWFWHTVCELWCYGSQFKILFETGSSTSRYVNYKL